VALLPQQYNVSVAAAGSGWSQAFTMRGDDGRPLDLTGLTWELVIRPSVTDTATPALVQVSTTPSTQGYITVDPATATVLAVLAPAATALLGKDARPYALWSNPHTTTAQCWVQGIFHTQAVAAA
jgi:hypothetical protein